MAEFSEKVVVGPPVALDLQGTNVPALVVPFTSADKYATHDEEFGRGGYRSVATVAEMNAIPGDRRKEGMLVNVIDDKIYKLVGSSFVPAFKTINGQSIVGPGNLTISGGSGGTSTPNLKLDIRTFKDTIDNTVKLQFKFYEKVENGYICFLRRKRNTGVMWNSPKGYSVPYLSFVNGGLPYCMQYSQNNFTVNVSGYEPNVWYYVPFQQKFGTFVNSSGATKQRNFKGNVYGSPIYYNSSTGAAITKKTVRMDCALQYVQFDPAYLAGQQVNGVKPQPFLNAGEMQKFNLYLRGKIDFATPWGLNIGIK